MRTVRRIFEMVAEGSTLYGVKRRLDSSGIKSPAGRSWNVTTIRKMLKDDVYRPHTARELESLVSSEVAARLARDKAYGVFWFNTKRHTETHVAESGPNGRIYRRKVKAVSKPREEWIAVPVPDAGIPRELVDFARVLISQNTRSSSSGEDFGSFLAALYAAVYAAGAWLATRR